MIRLFVTAVLLFLLEVHLFCAFSPSLLERLTAMDIKYLTFMNKQRRVVHNIQRQNELNRRMEPAIYVLGGSTSREFFHGDDHMSRVLKRPFVNLSASNQTLIDSLRLVDNIERPQAQIIYCIFPAKFMRFEAKIPPDSRYLMGAYLKYPVASNAVEDLLADVAPRNLATGLLSELNVYCYLLKDYTVQKHFQVQQMLVEGFSRPGKRLFTNDRAPVQHHYHHAAYDRNRLVVNLLDIKREIGTHLDTNLEINFDHLGRIVDLARRRGQQIDILELPYSAPFMRMFQRELRVYDQHLKAFLSKHPHVRFTRISYDTYKGRESLFYDHGHLLDSGRAYFNPLVENLFERDTHLVSHH